MNNKNKENLKDLFGKFFDPEQAQQASQDIDKANQLFQQYPAPQPHPSLIAGIKVEVKNELLREKTVSFRVMIYKTAVAAALVVISITIGVKLLEKKTNIEKTVISPIISGTTDKNNYIAADDNNLEILVAEAEQIGDEIMALQLNENRDNEYGDNEYGDVTELEMNFTEIKGDFWKG
jgi:hypothetical protein